LVGVERISSKSETHFQSADMRFFIAAYEAGRHLAEIDLGKHDRAKKEARLIFHLDGSIIKVTKY
jgi:hypothetical protein